jgi:signal transduction histidine kinase/HAMP domain-containing protein
MRASLKAKLTVLITFLVLFVVLTISSLYLSNLNRLILEEVENKAQYLANEIYHEASTVLAQSRMPMGKDPVDFEELRRFVQTRLVSDAGLTAIMDSAIGYSPTIYYVCITDERGEVLIHDDPGVIGTSLGVAPLFRYLIRMGLFRQLRVIYGRPEVYEVVLPLSMAGKPLGDVRVGVSTLFLRDRITPALHDALVFTVLAVLLATVSAGLVSYRTLRPLDSISQRVERLARGEFSGPVQLNRSDEWGILSSKLNILGEQIRGEKAAFVQLKENLDQIFSRLADGLLLFDQQDRLVLATPAVSRFLGRSPEVLVHRPVEEVFGASSPLDLTLREAFRLRRPLEWQTVELGAPSETPRVAVNLQFVQERDERVASLVTLRDASTRAQLEDEIDLSAKLAALGRLTSGVAHEVKNPLNAMILQVELLKSKLAGKGDRVMPQLETLSSEIRRLDRVVKTFLDFTRPIELRLADTEIEELVGEVFILAEPLAQQNHVRLVLEPNGALPPVKVDRDLIKQALLNIVLNGCQAMPSGGELKVTPNAGPRHVELEIADQGVGIPPAARARIFSLYYTTKPNGTGIGLAMAFRIVQLHNGSIDFSSELNRGTTFRVSLPR